jgi:hypothetical protein
MGGWACGTRCVVWGVGDRRSVVEGVVACTARVNVDTR